MNKKYRSNMKVSIEYEKYLCPCVKPVIEHEWINGVHKDSPDDPIFKFSDKWVYNYFMCIPEPAHAEIKGERICLKLDKRNKN